MPKGKEQGPCQQISFEIIGNELVEPITELENKTIEDIYKENIDIINDKFVAFANNALLSGIRKKINFPGTDEELNSKLFVINIKTPTYLVDKDEKTYSTDVIVVFQVQERFVYDNPIDGTARYMFVSLFNPDFEKKIDGDKTSFRRKGCKSNYIVNFEGKNSDFYIFPDHAIPIKFSKDTSSNGVKRKAA